MAASKLRWDPTDQGGMPLIPHGETNPKKGCQKKNGGAKIGTCEAFRFL
jgi:hypothetical protein